MRCFIAGNVDPATSRLGYFASKPVWIISMPNSSLDHTFRTGFANSVVLHSREWRY
jgi:hypothetical protein